MTIQRTTTRGRPRFSRRAALRLAGGAGLATTLTGHSGGLAAQESGVISIPDTGAQLPADEVTLRWVDSGGIKAGFWRQFFPAYQEAHSNVSVAYETLPWPEIAQVVPIGVQNGNAHDVFQLPLNIPAAQAVREGWVAPLDDIVPDFARWRQAFPPSALVSGVNVFDGKTYSFPLHSNKRYGTLLLYNVDYMTQAGYDPMTEPLTWDTFRDAAKKITEQGEGQYYGIVIEGNQTNRFAEYVSTMGRLAGASAGPDDIDWHTGQYVYTSDQYLAAIDLLLALQSDGSVFPGSMSLNAQQARAQMPQGIAGIILQGPWNVPQWREESPDFAFGLASAPLPNEGSLTPLTVGPGGEDQFWIFADSPLKTVAGDIFAYLGSVEGQTAYQTVTKKATGVIFPRANEAAAGDPLSERALAIYDEQIRTGPDPRVRNPETAQVYGEMQTLTPDFGQTIQGIFAGQLDDPRAAMQDLQDRADAELERAITAAQDSGAQVSRDDWIFPNWDPARDYAEADYQALGA